ncbi:LysR family transcriptional regulator [Geothrix limicola]|uniref:LysR family transcriptional regulator n=1 Tax=Geothrix limicola TaxID=2927978 RepID=A0ABQ5QIY6_9BACT|nr:LysR family transcriptional regulator [Geothrix limicola]GLH74663.1 LysR family transcriptional regulator [Geothrix limicola]
MTLDLEALRALEAVVKEGGFAKAALVLNKAQSAVSYQVRKLEQSLGVALLDRGAYRAALTPAGETLLAEGQRILTRARHLEDLAHQFASGWEPRLSLVIDGILPLEPIMTALKRIADDQVPTRIQVKVEFLRGVQYRFDKEEADLMLVKDFQPSPSLCAIALPEVECVLCAASGHPLASGEVELKDLRKHVELSVQDSSDRGDDRHMFGGERVFYLSGFVLKKQALRMGLGFGWMPLYLVETELAAGDLVELSYAGGSRYTFTPQLVTRRERPLGRTGRLLADHLCRAIEDSVG